MKRGRKMLWVSAGLCCFCTVLVFLAFIYAASADESPVLRISDYFADTPFETIQAAYDDTGTTNTDEIECHSGLFGEVLFFGRTVAIRLTGGFDVGFGNNPGMTEVNSLTIGAGTVVVERITIVGNICGNGVVESGEACDDGNVADGDGCSSTCAVEPGYTCIGSPSVCMPI
jgi:cysteine-rich repeat protein